MSGHTNFGCSKCDFKSTGGMNGLSKHYKENPTHRRTYLGKVSGKTEKVSFETLLKNIIKDPNIIGNEIDYQLKICNDKIEEYKRCSEAQQVEVIRLKHLKEAFEIKPVINIKS